MSQIRLFTLNNNVKELESETFTLEVELQNQIENNMRIFFQVDFLASEYSFAGGRIDSLGIDENNSPVIFEYKRSMNENVINQGLYYLEWLLDHKADFEILVRDKFGKERGSEIEWNNPVVYCIAHEFTKYDINAVKQMQRNIRLVEYKKYKNIILFDFINLDLKIKPLTTSKLKKEVGQLDRLTKTESRKTKSIENRMEVLNESLKPILEELRNYITSLSDDVSEVITKQYIAYKKVTNFVALDMSKDKIQVYLKLNPDKIEFKKNMRDMRNIGHYGTGDVEYIIKSKLDLIDVREYIDLAFRKN